MMKVFAGMVIGGLAVYFAVVYPSQSKQAIRTGIDATTSMVAQGTVAAKNAADQQFAKNSK